MLFDSALYPIDVFLFFYMAFALLYACVREEKEMTQRESRIARRRALYRKRAEECARLHAADR